MWKLKGKNITKFFGGVSALKRVNFILSEGEIVGLIGPNGAGKTTLFNVVAGVYNLNEGTIYFDGKNISNLKPYQICRQGIGRTFQIPRPFLEMNCIDSVMISIIGREEKICNKDEKLREAKKALKFVDLDDCEKILGKNLTLIQKKKLEVARALAT
ncbi:ATP-binding cassette domain-containing protein, partial [bacterium]|nr:ATP-binding cassette domain-containing protein [bacterium]